MSTGDYKIQFQTVSVLSHPEHYHMGEVCSPTSTIPDEHWHTSSRTDDLVSITMQYNGLHVLMKQGEPIKNIKMFRQVIEPTWVEYTPAPMHVCFRCGRDHETDSCTTP